MKLCHRAPRSHIHRNSTSYIVYTKSVSTNAVFPLSLLRDCTVCFDRNLYQVSFEVSESYWERITETMLSPKWCSYCGSRVSSIFQYLQSSAHSRSPLYNDSKTTMNNRHYISNGQSSRIIIYSTSIKKPLPMDIEKWSSAMSIIYSSLDSAAQRWALLSLRIRYVACDYRAVKLWAKQFSLHDVQWATLLQNGG